MISYFIFLFTVLIYITQRQHSITKNLPKKKIIIPSHYLCMLIYTCKKKKIKGEALTITQKKTKHTKIMVTVESNPKKSQKHLYN